MSLKGFLTNRPVHKLVDRPLSVVCFCLSTYHNYTLCLKTMFIQNPEDVLWLDNVTLGLLLPLLLAIYVRKTLHFRNAGKS